MKQETVCSGCGLVFCAACELSSLDFAARHHGSMCLKCEETAQHKTTDKAGVPTKSTAPHGSVANTKRTEASSSSATRDPSMSDGMRSKNCAGEQKHHHVHDAAALHTTKEASTGGRTCGDIFYCSDDTPSHHRMEHGSRRGVLKEVPSSRANSDCTHHEASIPSKCVQNAMATKKPQSSHGLRTFANFARADFDAFFSAVARTADNGIITAEQERRVYDLVAKQDSRLLAVYLRFRTDLDMYAFGMALSSLVQSDV